MAEVDLNTSKISAKIVILGEPAVGKTTLRHSFMGDKMTKDYSMTLGADIVITSIDINPSTSLESQIWDLAGQETFKPLIRSFVQGAHGAILAFDLTRPDTFDKISDWLDFLHEANPHLDNNIPFLIIGNKADLEGFIKMDDQDVHDFMDYVNRLNVYSQTPTQYIRTSAKTGYKVTEAFRKLGEIIVQNFKETGQEDILNKIIQRSETESQATSTSESPEEVSEPPVQDRISGTAIDETEDQTPIAVDDDSSDTVDERFGDTTQWQISSSYDLDFPNPYDVVNTFIGLGKELIDHEGNLDEDLLSSKIRTFYSLDTLLTTDLGDGREFSLDTYRDAIDYVQIIPELYFDIIKEDGRIGKTLVIKNIDKLTHAMNLYQNYRDPRRRDPNRVQEEMLLESILSQGKLEASKSGQQHVNLALSRIQTSSGRALYSLSDIPTLKVERFIEDKKLFSRTLTLTTFAQLKQGKMVYPDLIRILNIIEQDTLHDYMLDQPILQISRIISSVQRLADIIYASNFGYLEYALNTDIIEQVYAKPIETRSNLPESDAKDLVTFLNNLTSLSPSYAGIADHMRRINYCAKPLNDETADLTMINTTSEAIKQILSIIHYVEGLEDMEDHLQIMIEMIRDPYFLELSQRYFDPDFELLHAPVLTAIQGTFERLRVYLSVTRPSERMFSTSDLHLVSDVLIEIVESLMTRPITKDFVEIWARINDYMTDKIDFSLKSRSLDQVYKLIRGKEMILNIMTPLLLAKYDGRGYNPLAAIEDEQLESKIKNITGIIAIGCNLSTPHLEEFLQTMFVEAPEVSNRQYNPLNIPAVSSGSWKRQGGQNNDKANLVPTPMGIGLARIANEYVTGGGERNLYKAIVDLIKYTKQEGLGLSS